MSANTIERQEGGHRGYDVRASDVHNAQPEDQLVVTTNGQVARVMERGTGPKVVADDLTPLTTETPDFSARLATLRPTVEQQIKNLFEMIFPSEGAEEVIRPLLAQESTPPKLVLNLAALGIGGPKIYGPEVMKWQDPTERHRNTFLAELRDAAQTYIRETLIPELYGRVDMRSIQHQSTASGDIYNQLDISETKFTDTDLEFTIDRSRGRGR